MQKVNTSGQTEDCWSPTVTLQSEWSAMALNSRGETTRPFEHNYRHNRSVCVPIVWLAGKQLRSLSSANAHTARAEGAHRHRRIHAHTNGGTLTSLGDRRVDVRFKPVRFLQDLWLGGPPLEVLVIVMHPRNLKPLPATLLVERQVGRYGGQ